MERGLLAELSPQEAFALLRIANVSIDADDIAEANITRLQSLGLVEQRGLAFGLTLMGIQRVARLRRG